jgi:L-threonylcarbamoyladenylate synthase
VKVVAPDAAGIALAAEALRAGEVVLYPTETVYGLAVDPFSPAALRKLFQVKGRPDDKSILLIVADEHQLDHIANDIGPQSRACMRRFWPGPLSLILPARPGLLREVVGPHNTICARCPGLAAARDLAAVFGRPITSTSANLSGEAPIISVNEVALEGISVAIDGGTLGSQPPSTIFDAETGKILRQGSVTGEQLLVG